MKINVSIYSPNKNNSKQEGGLNIEQFKEKMNIRTCKELNDKININDQGKSAFLEGDLRIDSEYKKQKNLFLHGSSGTGKTHLVELIKEYYENHHNGYITLTINSYDLFRSLENSREPNSLSLCSKSFKENINFLIKTIKGLNEKYNKKDSKNKKHIIVLFDEFDKFLNHDIFNPNCNKSNKIQEGDFTVFTNYMEQVKLPNVTNIFTSNKVLQYTELLKNNVILCKMFLSRLGGNNFEFYWFDLNSSINFIQKNLDKDIFSTNENEIRQKIIEQINQNIKIKKDLINEKLTPEEKKVEIKRIESEENKLSYREIFGITNYYKVKSTLDLLNSKNQNQSKLKS